MMDWRSPIGLGTAPMGSRQDGPLWWGTQDDEQSIATIWAAIEAGIDWIDTAPFYGWGHAERVVGRALASRPNGMGLLTKCGTLRGPDGRAREDASPESLRAGVAASLERLGVDRIDILQVHDPDPTTPIEATWQAMMQLVDDGLIGAGGLSNHSVDLMDRALAIGPIAVVQHQYSLVWRQPERDGVLDWCDRYGVPFLAWSPLASGYLVESFDIDSLHPDDLRRRLRWSSDECHDLVVRTRAVLGAVARRHETTMQAVALAWVTRQGRRAIVGARTPGEAAAAAVFPDLTSADTAELGDL